MARRANPASPSWTSEAATRPTTSSPTRQPHSASVNPVPGGGVRNPRGRTDARSLMAVFHHTAGGTPTESPGPRDRRDRHAPFYQFGRNRLRPRTELRIGRLKFGRRKRAAGGIRPRPQTTAGGIPPAASDPSLLNGHAHLF